jgi:hypothetical protein
LINSISLKIIFDNYFSDGFNFLLEIFGGFFKGDVFCGDFLNGGLSNVLRDDFFDGFTGSLSVSKNAEFSSYLSFRHCFGNRDGLTERSIIII